MLRLCCFPLAPPIRHTIKRRTQLKLLVFETWICLRNMSTVRYRFRIFKMSLPKTSEISITFSYLKNLSVQQIHNFKAVGTSLIFHQEHIICILGIFRKIEQNLMTSFVFYVFAYYIQWERMRPKTWIKPTLKLNECFISLYAPLPSSHSTFPWPSEIGFYSSSLFNVWITQGDRYIWEDWKLVTCLNHVSKSLTSSCKSWQR